MKKYYMVFACGGRLPHKGGYAVPFMPALEIDMEEKRRKYPQLCVYAINHKDHQRPMRPNMRLADCAYGCKHKRKAHRIFCQEFADTRLKVHPVITCCPTEVEYEA